jgi:hypothetical protein
MIAAASLLFSGSEILTNKLLFIHAGTLLAWIAITAFAYFSYLIVQSNPKLKIVQRVVLLLALLWFVVSSLLAGNTDLIFPSTSIWRVWIFYTAVIVSISVFTSLSVAVKIIIQKFSN